MPRLPKTFWGRSLVALAGLFLLWKAYAFQFHGSWRAREPVRRVRQLELPYGGWALASPFFFRSAADPEVLFVGTAPPDGLQPDGRIWRLAGGTARPAAFSAPFVISDNYLSRPTPSPASLRDTSGTTLAVGADTKRGLFWRLSFHGFHLRRPVYYPLAFPDPSYAGFHWAYSYTGTRRLEVWRSGSSEPLAVFEQRVWNSAATLVLSDVAHYDEPLGLLAIVDSLRSTGRLMVVDLKE